MLRVRGGPVSRRPTRLLVGFTIHRTRVRECSACAVNQASLDLVKLSNPLDEAFLVDFSSEAYIDQDFTDSIAKLEEGLKLSKVAKACGQLRWRNRRRWLGLLRLEELEAFFRV